MDETAVLKRVLAESVAFLDGLPGRPVNARYDVDDVAEALGGPLPETGTDPYTVIEELLAGAEPGVVAMPSPRFFGWVIGGVLPAALGADWLTSVWIRTPACSPPRPRPPAPNGWLPGGCWSCWTCPPSLRSGLSPAG